MNNALIVENLEDIGKTPEGQAAKNVQKLSVIEGLKNSRHYRKFVEMFIRPEIESLTTRLKSTNDLIAVYRLQGKIEGLEKFADLIKVEKSVRSKLNRN